MIGLDRIKDHAEWTWIDGSPITYTNWEGTVSNNENQKAAKVFSTGKWETVYGTTLYPKYFMCEHQFQGMLLIQIENSVHGRYILNGFAGKQ